MKKKLILIISIFLIGINNVYANDEVKYVNCIDGDTIRVLLNDEEKTVRLLAIDAPEDSPNRVDYYGKEASEYTCNKIKKAKKISLEYDQNSDKYDKYDRVLAWVFIDDKLLEEELVKNGYAQVAYLYNDYKYTSKLKEQEEKAKEKGIPFIMSLGMANRFDPSKVKIAKLNQTHSDPLAKKIRYMVKKQGLDTSNINVVISEELPQKNGDKLYSIMTVPSSAGLSIAKFILSSIIIEK